jgi:elongator complex protein 1
VCLHAPYFTLLLICSYRQSKSQDPDKTALLCDSLRLELEKRGVVKYMNCILTSDVIKTPPDYEAALSLMHRLRRMSPPMPLILWFNNVTESDPQAVEAAVRYIMFLVDPDKLFDIALGMYDFSLVLLIAQNSQKV